MNKRDSLWTVYGNVGKLTQGKYKDDLKTGAWVHYNLWVRDELPHAKGSYDKGKRIGIWDFYDREGAMVQQYDFEKDTLIVMDSSRALYPEIFAGKYKGLVFLDKMPSFKGGTIALLKYLVRNQRYPEEARYQRIVGDVVVSAFIDEQGNLYNCELREGKDLKYLSEEAMRLLKNTSGRWLPAEFEGEPVPSRMPSFPIRFILR